MLRVAFPRTLQLLVGLAVTSFGLVIASFGTFAIAPPPETAADAEAVVRVMSAVLGVCGGIVVVGGIRSARACVRIYPDRIAVRSTWRTRTLPLAQVRRFVVSGVAGAVPVFALRCLGVEMKDDAIVQLRESRTWSQSRAEAAVIEANEYLNGARER